MEGDEAAVVRGNTDSTAEPRGVKHSCPEALPACAGIQHEDKKPKPQQLLPSPVLGSNTTQNLLAAPTTQERTTVFETHFHPTDSLVRRIGEGSQGEVWLLKDKAGDYYVLKIPKDPKAGTQPSYRSSTHYELPLQLSFTDNEATYRCCIQPYHNGPDFFDLVSKSHAPFLPDGVQYDLFNGGLAELSIGEPAIPNPCRNALSIKDKLEWALALLYQLGEAHSVDVVHKDVKLENVILTKQGEVRLVDFGACVIAGSHALPSCENATSPTSFKFMCENGHDVHQVQHTASDVYSFVVSFLMRLILEANLPTLGMRRANVEACLPLIRDPELRDFVRRATDPDREQRLTVPRCIEELERLLSQM